MIIIQIADLHITEETNMKYIKLGISKMVSTIKKCSHDDEYMLLVCGDIIDAKANSKGAYEIAEKVFEQFKEEFSEHKFYLSFVPGNHEIVNSQKDNASLKMFDEFASKQTETKYRFDCENVMKESHCGINFILASSVKHRDHTYGEVDLKAIEDSCEGNDVIVTHHFLFSAKEKDRSAIDNAVDLISIMNCFGIKTFLYGHTHNEQCILEIGNITCCGVEKYNMNYLWPSFNILKLSSNNIESIKAFRYEKLYDDYNTVDMLKKRKGLKQSDNNVIIKKIEYKEVENYIQRYVTQITLLDNESNSFWEEKNKTNIIDALNKNNRIILLSEAGCGKTTELKNVAYIMSKEDKFPVIINLNRYVNQEIEDMINKDYKHLEQNLILLFDGFDEIKPNKKSEFANKLCNYCKKNIDTKVIVTSRFNFYTKDDFIDFQEYRLENLKKDEQNKYILMNTQNSENFIRSIKESNLEEFLVTPFYLELLIIIYDKDKELPNREILLQKFIKNRFEIDKSKYRNNSEVKEVEYHTYCLLQKISFAMMLIGKNRITESEYQKLINIKDRRYLKCSGILTKDNENWEFQHNNFREYLTAEYLNTMEHYKIIEFIMGCDDRIDEKWLNIVSFLISFKEQKVLLKMLIEKAELLVLKFEKDKVSPRDRLNIFKKIIYNYKIKNLWIDSNESISRNLVQFSKSKDAIKFLLCEISIPKHFRALSNAIRVLSRFDNLNLYDENENIIEVLLTCCESSETRHYEKSNVIDVLTTLKLNSNEVTKKLLELFSTSKFSEIRMAMYRYLSKSGSLEENIDFFLFGLNCLFKGYDRTLDGATTMEGFVFQESIKYFVSPKSINRLLEAIIHENYNWKHFYNYEKVIEILIESVIKVNNEGYNEQYDIMVKHLFTNHKMLYIHENKVYKRFFEETHTLKQVCDEIFCLNKNEMNETDIIILLEYIMSEDILKDYIKSYLDGNLENNKLITRLIERNLRIIYSDRELEKAVLNKGTINLVKLNNYDGIIRDRKKNKQKYFDSLFDQIKFNKLIIELINISGNLDIKFNEIPKIGYKRTENRMDLMKLKIALQHYFYKNGESRIFDFVQTFDWENFCIYQIYKELNTDKDEVEISEKQTEYIKKYYYGNINKVNFINNEFIEIMLIFFMIRFELHCDENILLDMLMVPQNYFSYYDKLIETEKINYTETPFGYLEIKIDSKIIESRIIENVVNKKLEKEVLRSHLIYCKKHKISEAVELATKICKKNYESIYYKCDAIEYLIELKGSDYIYKMIIPEANNELLLNIARLTEQKANAKIVKFYEKYYFKDNRNYQLLEYLISMNSKVGLKGYYNEIVKIGKDKRENNSTSQIDNLTRKIEEVNDIKNLYWVVKLIKLRFNGKFNDNGFYSLYNALHEIVNNMCTQNKKIFIPNYKIIVTKLNYLIKKYNKNEELIGFCNRLLLQLTSRYRRENRRIYSIREVRKIVELE